MIPKAGKTQTPWGVADSVETIADGIYWIGTPSHGGFKLDRKMNAKMPPAFRLEGGYYEEDCNWSFVVHNFPQYFPAEDIVKAESFILNYSPERYEAHYQCSILPGRSRRKDEEQFYKVNANNLLGVAAWGDWKEGVPKGMVLICAVIGSEVENQNRLLSKDRYFLVTKERHDSRGKYNYVIDLENDKEVSRELAYG